MSGHAVICLSDDWQLKCFTLISFQTGSQTFKIYVDSHHEWLFPELSPVSIWKRDKKKSKQQMQRCKRKWRANAVLTELSTNFHNWRHIRGLAFLRPPHHDHHVIPHHRYGVRGQNSRLDVTRVLTLGCSGMGHLDLGTGQIEHCQGDSDSFGALLDKTLPNTERYSQSCCDFTTAVVIFFPMVIKYLKIFG